MRHMRLAVVLFFALALCAESLLTHAARARSAAEALAASAFCASSPDGDSRHHDRTCLDQCLTSTAPVAPAPQTAALVLQTGAPMAATVFAASGRRAASGLVLDHAPRGPPAVA